nr:hypothetical protein [Tanacetum cinerariifolium]
MTEKYFVEYIGIEVKHFRDTLLQHMVMSKSPFLKEHVINDSLIEGGTESEVQDDNSRSGNDADADDADIRPIYDKEPMAKYDRRVNKRLMQTQNSKIDMGKAVNDDLVVTKSSGTESKVQDDNSRSGNDPDADDADIFAIG